MAQNTNIIVLQPTTDAANSDEFIIGNFPSISVSCVGLQGSETAKVQYLDPVTETWVDYYQNGNLILFTATQTAYSVWDDAATFRISKQATTASVGVSVTSYTGAL